MGYRIIPMAGKKKSRIYVAIEPTKNITEMEVKRKRVSKKRFFQLAERKVDHCNEKCRVVKLKFARQNQKYLSGYGNEK